MVDAVCRQSRLLDLSSKKSFVVGLVNGVGVNPMADTGGSPCAVVLSASCTGWGFSSLSFAILSSSDGTNLITVSGSFKSNLYSP